MKNSKWCDSNLWIQEVLYLLSKKIEICPKEIANSYEAIEKIYKKSKIISPTQENLSKELKSGNYVFNLSYFGEKYSLTKPILNFENDLANSKYSSRLVSIPQNLIDSYFKFDPNNTGISEENDINKNPIISKQKTFESPRSLNNPGSDITAEITLISGDGEIEETFACLKMLAKYFKVPLKQDVFLKALNS